jgi:hypothetical protein
VTAGSLSTHTTRELGAIRRATSCVLRFAHDPPIARREAGDSAAEGPEGTVPVSARIWNYWAGGTGYYLADELAADAFAALYPGIRDMASISIAGRTHRKNPLSPGGPVTIAVCDQPMAYG